MAEVVKLRRPATRDHLRKKPPPERLVEVYLDEALHQAYVDAEDALGRARLRAESSQKPRGADAALAEAIKARDKAKAALDEETVEIRLRSIGRKGFRMLQEQHPPTEKDIQEWQAQLDQMPEASRWSLPRPAHNAETLSVALLAASAVEPKLTEEEWQEILDEWTPAEATKLQSAAFQLYGQGDLVELGKVTSSNGSNGITG